MKILYFVITILLAANLSFAAAPTETFYQYANSKTATDKTQMNKFHLLGVQNNLVVQHAYSSIKPSHIGAPSLTGSNVFTGSNNFAFANISTFNAKNIIARGPVIDAAYFMDGQAGRPTFAQWKADSTIDVTSVINAAVQSLIPSLGGTVRLSIGTFTISSPITLYRGVRLIGVSTNSSIIQNNGNSAAVNFAITSGGAGALHCAVENLSIIGTGNIANTDNVGIDVANSAQYSNFENLKIKDTGGISINFSNSGFGSIYNTFTNVQVMTPRGYGLYMTGNSAQVVFNNLRIVSPYSDGVVFEACASCNSSVMAVTFIGGGVESPVAAVYHNNTHKAVYFKGLTSYAAHTISFINFYLEPNSPTATGDVTGYYIESGYNIQIIGGMTSFAHWGLRAVGRYANNIYISNNTMFNSSGFAGGDTSGLAIKSQISIEEYRATVVVGPMFNATPNTITWPFLNDPNNVFVGYGENTNQIQNMVISNPGTNYGLNILQSGASAGLRVQNTATGNDTARFYSEDVNAFVKMRSGTNPLLDIAQTHASNALLINQSGAASAFNITGASGSAGNWLGVLSTQDYGLRILSSNNVSAAANLQIEKNGTGSGKAINVINKGTGLSLNFNNGTTDIASVGATGVATFSGLNITSSSTPASNAACTQGAYTWDASYIYICTASGVWKRAALTGGY